MDSASSKARIRELEEQLRERDHRIAEIGRDAKLLQRAVNALPYPLIVVDCETYRVEYGNTSSGFSPKRSLATCHLLSHHSPGPCDSPTHPCPLEIITRTRKPTTVEHIHFKAPHRAEVVEVQAFPLLGSDGHVEKMVELTFNVTALRSREQRLKESATTLATLNEAASRLMRANDVKEACRIALRATHDVFGRTVCAVKVAGRQDMELIITSSMVEIDALPELDDLRLDQTHTTTGQVLLFESRAEMPPRWREIPGAEWAVVCPVPNVGSLAVIGSGENVPDSRRLELLQNLTEQLTETTRRLLHHKQLETAVATDPLTGAYSRAVLQQILDREMQDATAHDGHLSIVMIDVDDFKRINDRQGHLCGDRVLQKVAELIMSQLRPSERPIRYGGDEFLLLIPAPVLHATRVVERIRKQLARHNQIGSFELDEQQVSLSVGLAEWRHDSGQEIGDAISEADSSMYKDKRARAAASCPADVSPKP